MYSAAFRIRSSEPLGDAWKSYYRDDLRKAIPADTSGLVVGQKAYRFLCESADWLRIPTISWTSSLAPWTTLLTAVEQEFGFTYRLIELATIGAGIESSSDLGNADADLLDHSVDLAQRARAARLRSGQSKWWISAMERSERSLDRSFVLLLFLTWATPKALSECISHLSKTLSKLKPNEAASIQRSLEHSISLGGARTSPLARYIVETLPVHDLSARTAALLINRAAGALRRELFNCHMRETHVNDPVVNHVGTKTALTLLRSHELSWSDAIVVLGNGYRAGITSEPFEFHRLRRRGKIVDLPVALAREIADNPLEYPGYLVGAAEQICRVGVEKRIRPVLATAQREHWFEHD